jgi:hypothetical protein
MGKEDVLAILDKVRESYRVSLTERVIPLVKEVVEEAYRAAEECRVEDTLNKIASYAILQGQYIAELPPEKVTFVAGMLVNARWKMVEDIAKILEEKCKIRR